MIATTDYERLREAVGLVDRSERGKLRLTGDGAAEFLQGQVTNDVESLAVGEGCYAALLSPKGKMLADMRILRGDGWLWIDCEPVALAAVAKNARTYSIGRDVRVADVGADEAILSLIGPAARAALDVEPPAAEHAFVAGGHGVYVATDLGVDVICRAEEAHAVRASLGVAEFAREAAECLRVESGRPRYGIDMGADTIPQEAGLNERAVSFTKGCYVGQETVARLHYKGKSNRHLRGLRLDAPGVTGEPVKLGERLVGTLGSTAISPVFGPIGLAILRREVTPGETVTVGGDERAAEAVELPF